MCSTRPRLAGRQVFIFGNGGSASTATHMACDLSKNTAMPGTPRLRTIALERQHGALLGTGQRHGL